MKMSNFQYCAACLVSGVKLHSYSYNSRISTDNITVAFSKILNTSLDVCSNSFCFECARLLAKYAEFRSKCCRAQSILSVIETEDANKIYNHIQNIDRIQNRLVTNLSPSQTICHDNQTPIDNKHEIQSNIAAIKTEIEHEDFGEHNFEDTLHYEPGNKNSEIKITTRKRKVKIKRKLQEKSKLILNKELSSDDEPLAKKVAINADFKMNYKIYKSVTSEKDSTKTKVGKKYKDFYDFEEYATILFLTPEDARKEVLLRKESSNYLNSPLKCNMCYRGYEAKLAFDNHMKKHSIEYGEYQCEFCQLRFPQQRYLCKHTLASHKRKFCCKICPYICFCMHQAKTHVSLHKGKKYPCKECREVFSMPNSLLMHKRQKHPTECVCELCGHTFATPRGLYSHHMKIHRQHKNEKLGPKCPECNKHFATEAAWKVHLVLSSKHNVSNGCKFCGETFSSQQELKSHAREHARRHAGRGQGQVPGQCPMCDKWLDDRVGYRSHVLEAHPSSEAARKLDVLTPFVCEVCGMMFKKQCFLTYHQRKHTGERPYKCAECGKAFHSAGALTTHRALHTDTRAHKCGLCARVFTFKSVLNKHMKVHLGVRPHRCDICDKSFVSPCDVRVHVRYVHNKTPWPKRDRKLTEPNYHPNN